MEKAKALVALLLTFVLLIGIVTPCLADEDVAEYTTEVSTEPTTEVSSETSTSEDASEPQSSEAAQDDNSSALSSIIGSIFGLTGESEETTETAETTEATEAAASTTEAEAEDAALTEQTAIPASESETVGEAESVTETAAAATAEAAEKIWSINPIVNYVYKNGVPAVTTQSFTSIYRMIKSIANFFQGRFLWNDDDIFDVTLDEKFVETTDFLTENSCLNVPMILTNLPDLTEPATIIDTVFQIDVAEMREELYAKRDELYATDKTKADLVYFFTAYMCGIKSAYIYLQPYDGDKLEIALDVTYSDGVVEKFVPGIYYNPDTGLWYGKSEKGVGGIGFNSNTKEMLVYAPMYCWMRNFGFCFEYDLLCYILPVYCYNTRRIKFEYAGKEWMIQMWKGNYLITNGGEIGVYNRPIGSLGTYYDCITDDELLPMSLKILHGNDVLVDMAETPHWWVNGFKMGTRLYSPHSLTLIGTIRFDNERMLAAFLEGLEENVYHDIEYSVDGLTVTLVWDT